MLTSKPTNGLRLMQSLKPRKSCRQHVAYAISRVVSLLRAIYVQPATSAYPETKPDVISVRVEKFYLDGKPSNARAHCRPYTVCALAKNSHGQLLRLTLADVRYENTLRTGDDAMAINAELIGY